MKKYIIAIALLSTTFQASATGIPVFDAASVMQAILSVQELKAQLEEQKRTYESMNGSRGMGKLLNNPALRNYLPGDWQKVYDNVNRGGVGGLTGAAQDILKENQLFECSKLSPANKKICERQAGLAAQEKAFGLEAYEQSNRRINQIEALMNKINETQDPKAIAELNARLQAENALIQNEQIKLQMFTELSKAEANLIAQQQREKAMADAHRQPGTTFKLKEY